MLFGILYVVYGAVCILVGFIIGVSLMENKHIKQENEDAVAKMAEYRGQSESDRKAMLDMQKGMEATWNNPSNMPPSVGCDCCLCGLSIPNTLTATIVPLEEQSSCPEKS